MNLLQAMGLTLLHFIWQGAVLGLILGAVLLLLRRKSPNVRYLFSCMGLAVMTITPVLTLIWVLNTNPINPADPIPMDPAAFDPYAFFFPITPYLTIFWLLGAFALQARLILNWSRAQHLKNCGVKPAPHGWIQKTRELCNHLNIKQPVKILESALAQTPMVLGWLKPVILLPTSALTGLTPDQLKTIILHELAHVKRHDYLINLMQSVCETLLFFHPAVWWVSSRIRLEREYCCDDVAVTYSRNPLCYVKALSSLDLIREGAGQTVMASSGGPLMKRIFRIAGQPSRPAHRWGNWLAPLIIALFITVAAVSLAASSSNEEDPAINKTIVKLEKQIKKIEQAKQEIILKKKKEGASKKEVQEALVPLKKEQEKLLQEKWMIQKEQDLIKVYKKKGLSKEEIKTELAKHRKRQKAPPKPLPEKESIKGIIAEMKAKGASEEEIKKFIVENNKKKELWLKKIKDKANQLRVALKEKGLSKEEIDKAVADFYDRNGVKRKKTKDTKK